MCKKLIKNSQPFWKKCQKTLGGYFFLTHTVERTDISALFSLSGQSTEGRFPRAGLLTIWACHAPRTLNIHLYFVNRWHHDAGARTVFHSRVFCHATLTTLNSLLADLTDNFNNISGIKCSLKTYFSTNFHLRLSHKRCPWLRFVSLNWHELWRVTSCMTDWLIISKQQRKRQKSQYDCTIDQQLTDAAADTLWAAASRTSDMELSSAGSHVVENTINI